MLNFTPTPLDRKRKDREEVPEEDQEVDVLCVAHCIELCICAALCL